jgi:hypothetical protein
MSVGVKARLLGVVFLGLAAFVAWHYGFRPLHEARAGAKSVEFSTKVFVAFPIAAVFGLVLFVGGGPVLAWGKKQPKSTADRAIAIVVLVLALGGGFVAYWWFRQELDALGYRDRY